MTDHPASLDYNLEAYLRKLFGYSILLAFLAFSMIAPGAFGLNIAVVKSIKLPSELNKGPPPFPG